MLDLSRFLLYLWLCLTREFTDFQTLIYTTMLSNPEIRQSARLAMQGKWGVSALLMLLSCIIFCVCSALQTEPSALTSILYIVVAVLILMPLQFGIQMMYLWVARDDMRPSVEAMFGGFTSKYYRHAVLTLLLMNIYIFLWTLLLIIPGIIKSLSYAMTPYIIAENPEIGTEEAICRSMEMMRGKKAKLFLIILGEAGLVILSSVALFIPVLWIEPYYQTVYAKFYLSIK